MPKRQSPQTRTPKTSKAKALKVPQVQSASGKREASDVQDDEPLADLTLSSAAASSSSSSSRLETPLTLDQIKKFQSIPSGQALTTREQKCAAPSTLAPQEFGKLPKLAKNLFDSTPPPPTITITSPTTELIKTDIWKMSPESKVWPFCSSRVTLGSFTDLY